MNNLGVALAGGNGNRRANDFYPTPPEATWALLLAADQYIGPVVHEMACGTGEMADAIALTGREVIATDLVDRDYGRDGVDFLSSRLLAPCGITNPPFNLADKFLAHAMAFEPTFFAMLLKATFWHARRRYDLLRRYPPRLIMPLTWRLDFTDGGAPTMDCTWFCWGSALPETTQHIPLLRPDLSVLTNLGVAAVSRDAGDIFA